MTNILKEKYMPDLVLDMCHKLAVTTLCKVSVICFVLQVKEQSWKG